jgi:hypothetical protein
MVAWSRAGGRARGWWWPGVGGRGGREWGGVGGRLAGADAGEGGVSVMAAREGWVPVMVTSGGGMSAEPGCSRGCAVTGTECRWWQQSVDGGADVTNCGGWQLTATR